MLIKKLKDHLHVTSPTCGNLFDIIQKGDYEPLGLAVAEDIKPTVAHYHNTFDEIYFVLDGEIELVIYDPETKKISRHSLVPNELVVITKGLHHKISKASSKNRLCVISVPPFYPEDERVSTIDF